MEIPGSALGKGKEGKVLYGKALRRVHFHGVSLASWKPYQFGPGLQDYQDLQWTLLFMKNTAACSVRLPCTRGRGAGTVLFPMHLYS